MAGAAVQSLVRKSARHFVINKSAYNWLYPDSVMRTSLRTFAPYRRTIESGGPSVVTIQSMLTAKCTAARSSFALTLSAENRSGTGPASRQLQETVGGVVPAGLFSWFALQICATAQLIRPRE